MPSVICSKPALLQPQVLARSRTVSDIVLQYLKKFLRRWCDTPQEQASACICWLHPGLTFATAV